MIADKKEYHVKLFNYALAPIILYGCISAYMGATYGMQSGWTWFSWHPFCMTIGYVIMASNAILLKKIGGYTNTQYHGYIMFSMMLLTCFAWYVIYERKEFNNKQHFTSNHGQLGLFVMISNICLALFGYVALNPDTGFFKTNQLVRACHKYGGRAIVALSWITCVLGIMPMTGGDLSFQIAYGAPLVIMGFFLLL